MSDRGRRSWSDNLCWLQFLMQDIRLHLSWDNYNKNNRPFAHFRLYIIRVCIFYMRVISLTSGKMVPGLARATDRTTYLSIIVL
jgi:hypothetical protein